MVDDDSYDEGLFCGGSFDLDSVYDCTCNHNIVLLVHFKKKQQNNPTLL